MSEQNPYLEQEDYFAPYKDKINDLKNNPELIEFDKVCYELFKMNPMGNRFIELVKEKYLMNALVQKGTPTYQIDILWQEGFKDAFRMIIIAIKSHDERIKAGTK